LTACNYKKIPLYQSKNSKNIVYRANLGLKMAYIKNFLIFLALWRKNTSQKWYNCDIMTLHSGVSCALVKNNLLFL